jgi:hypothetical protein
VYQLAPPAKQGDPWTETVLYIFKGNTSNDGASPYGGLVIDAAGNLYGTTGYGGTGNCTVLGSKLGCGTVFEMSPPKQKGGQWTETVLYSFLTPKQGFVPAGDLVFDSAGNLYGATLYGGGYGTNCGDAFYQYCGAVFELSPRPRAASGRRKRCTVSRATRMEPIPTAAWRWTARVMSTVRLPLAAIKSVKTDRGNPSVAA